MILESVTTTESEWDETEQDWMLALQEYRATLCELCGLPRHICRDPKLAGKIEVGLPERCQITTALREAQQPYASNTDAEHVDALTFGIEGIRL